MGEGNGTPLQYCCLENPMDGGAWWAAVHGVAKSQTLLSDFTFTFYFHALENEMATKSSVLAWKIPWTEKPGRLQSMGSHRVGHDRSDLAAVLCLFIYLSLFVSFIVSWGFVLQFIIIALHLEEIPLTFLVRQVLVVMNSLRFCLPEKVFISLLKDSFITYGI